MDLHGRFGNVELAAITLLLSPRAIARRISSSRGESCASGEESASFGTSTATKPGAPAPDNGTAVGGDQLAGHFVRHHTRHASRAGWRRPRHQRPWSSADSHWRLREVQRLDRSRPSLTVSRMMRTSGSAAFGGHGVDTIDARQVVVEQNQIWAQLLGASLRLARVTGVTYHREVAAPREDGGQAAAEQRGSSTTNIRTGLVPEMLGDGAAEFATVRRARARSSDHFGSSRYRCWIMQHAPPGWWCDSAPAPAGRVSTIDEP